MKTATEGAAFNNRVVPIRQIYITTEVEMVPKTRELFREQMQVIQCVTFRVSSPLF